MCLPLVPVFILTGISPDDIKEMTINDTDYHFMLNSLNLQQKLIKDRIEQLQMVEKPYRIPQKKSAATMLSTGVIC